MISGRGREGRYISSYTSTARFFAYLGLGHVAAEDGKMYCPGENSLQWGSWLVQKLEGGADQCHGLEHPHVHILAPAEGKNIYVLALESFISQNYTVHSQGDFPVLPFNSYCPLLNIGSSSVC